MITRPSGSSIRLEDVMNAVSLADLGPENTDVTAAMNTALLAGKPIFIPEGQWLFTGLTLPVNAIIIGMGIGSILKLKDASNAVALTLNTDNFLQDFVIDGNKVNQVGNGLHGINITDVNRAKVHNVLVKNAKGCGYVLAGAGNDCVIKDCGVTGYTESGIKVSQGTDHSIINPHVYDSDAAASGDGIAVLSAGLAITGLLIDKPKVKNITGRGISAVGSGSRNITDMLIAVPRVVGTTNHGVFISNAESVQLTGGFAKTITGDGLRIEGDVQNSRILNFLARSCTAFGIREVVNGSTPNFNGLIHCMTIANANNVITKVGANSFVV